MTNVPLDIILKIKAALELLGNKKFIVAGQKVRASDCYFLNIQPTKIVFRENCPDELREAINAILKKYLGEKNELLSRN